MFLITVASVIVCLQHVEGGYDYRRPGIRLELPNNKRGPGVQGFARGILNEHKNSDEKKISFSLPYRDHNFLQHQRNGLNGRYYPNSFNTAKSHHQNVNLNTYRDFTGFKPTVKSNNNIGSIKIHSQHPQRFTVNRHNTVYGPPKIGYSQTLTHHQQVPIVRYSQNSGSQAMYVNNVQQTLQNFVPNFINANRNPASHFNLQSADMQNSLPAKVNFEPQLGVHYKKPSIFYNPQSIPNVLETHDQNIQQVATLHNVQNDISETYIPQINANIIPLLNNQKHLSQPIDSQNTVSPVITKHIYFHAPPPDIEEPSVEPPQPPPNKSYKIIFIKVPSQESRNIEELQEAYNRLSSIEDKTLIYVLSNNSKDSSQSLVPAYKPSEHEVLFVKYNDNHHLDLEDNLIEKDDAIYLRKR